MDKLLDSRRSRAEAPQKIGDISPEKYGKGAYCDLTFTPSKLADNVLFRDVSNMKKVEEQSSKCRQFETQNQVLIDQVSYLKKERDGISGSLNEIIQMYKGIIAEMEAKNDEHLKESQKKWSIEIQKYIKDKEEEARYFQSQRELLEERIQALESDYQALKDQLNETIQNKSTAETDLQLLRKDHKYLQQKLQVTQLAAEKDLQKCKDDIESLKKEYMLAQVEWKNTLNEELHRKDKQIESIERSHRADLQKIQTQRKNETILKNQEITDLARAFEMESARLKEILGVKDRMIQNLSIENNKEKNRLLKLTQEYETEINHLSHEKNRLIDQLEYIGKDNQILTKDKVLLTGDLEKENCNLRDLLYESSKELERCKKQFLGLAKQNSILLEKMRSAEDEARTWRESYYNHKTKAY